MEIVRVIIAMGSDTANSKIRAFLVENGYEVVEQSIEGNECLRKINAVKPDILILDSALPSVGGYNIARVVLEDKLSQVILICNQGEDMFSDLKESCNFSTVIKPINKSVLLNTLELMLKSKKRIRELEEEINSLKNTIDSRKEVDKAKALLMQHFNMTEVEAFKRIQKQSMDKGIPMKEIAKAIILAYDI